MNKNKYKNIEPIFEARNLGNWNYKDKSIPGVYTKPIGAVMLDGDSFVFRHAEILALIDFYAQIDLDSIKLIKEGNAGEIKNFETPFIEKVMDHIKLNHTGGIK